MIFSLVGNVVSSLLLALLITIVLISLLIWVMKTLYPRCLSNVNFGFILGIGFLAVMLFIQSFLFCGACYAKKYLNTAEEGMQIIVDIGNKSAVMEDEHLKMVKVKLIENYPVLDRYMKDMSESDLKTNLTNIVPYVRSQINGYLWRRVGWLLGSLVVVGGVLFYRAEREQQRAAYLRNRMMNL